MCLGSAPGEAARGLGRVGAEWLCLEKAADSGAAVGLALTEGPRVGRGRAVRGSG